MKLSHDPSSLTDLVFGGVRLVLRQSRSKHNAKTRQSYTRNVIKVVDEVFMAAAGAM